jgi:hypothetical protein
MRKLFVLLFLVCFATASAQEADTLFYKRTAFNTPIFIGNQNLSYDELVKLNLKRRFENIKLVELCCRLLRW